MMISNKQAVVLLSLTVNFVGPLNYVDYHNIISANLIITYTDSSIASTDDDLIYSLKKF